jgi:uncharacterized membrane protein YoaK (UPF0700 family)
MIFSLPRWVWSGAWALAFVAGFVNVVGLLSFEHRGVSHMTGITSTLAQALVEFKSEAIFHLLAIIAAFLAGSIGSGFLIQDSTLQLGRRYGVALLVESILLFAAVPLLNQQSNWGVYFTAAACGLQNAMASTYSGAVVRTTHLTGMFTDLGIILGHALRGMPIDMRRFSLCLLIICGFVSGGIVGVYAYRQWNNAALCIPASLTALAATWYGVYRLVKRRTARAG